ncbi:MAG TPA: CPBP family intramembrane glutamic endopeptidase [Ktedonobacteraceae bacterium]|nr:CPBP family intramembrane glutamic endopeptidase [Ktedonobacteraceae bacterium]
MALPTHFGIKLKTSWRQLVGTLLLLLAIIGVVSYGAFVVAYPFGWLAHPETRLATFLVGATLGELAALAVLLQLLHRRNISAQTLGLGKPTNWRGVVLGLVVAFLYIDFTALNPKVGSHLFQLTLLKGLAMAAALVAGLVEETIFRGYLMTSLEALGRGRVAQTLVSGAVFAVAHFYGFISPVALIITFGATFILGLGLAVTYMVGKRSLTPVIVSHVMIDLVIEPWLLLGFFTGA